MTEPTREEFIKKIESEGYAFVRNVFDRAVYPLEGDEDADLWWEVEKNLARKYMISPFPIEVITFKTQP